MKGIALAFSGLLLATPAQSPAPEWPEQYESLEPLKVDLTLADAQWVDRECRDRVGRTPPEGMVFKACAGVGRNWMIFRHGSLYPDECGHDLAHETAHIRGWYHG